MPLTSRIAAAGLALSLVAGAALAEPPAHAPAHGYRDKHHYVYYPEKQLYFAPETQMWFWRDGGSWTAGASLPVIYQQYAHGGYNVYLDVERPYEEQERVVSGYRRHEWTPYHYGDEAAQPPGHAHGPKKK